MNNPLLSCTCEHIDLMGVLVMDNTMDCPAHKGTVGFGTGEINDAGVAKALEAMGYKGPVGMETFAIGDEEAALEAFRVAFTL